MKRTPLPSHYETLRLDPHASPHRVRLAYRRMAQKFHPDKYQGRGDAANLMAQINLAYAVLSDPQQRQAYDALLQQGDPRSSARGRGAAMAAAAQDRFGWSGWLLMAIASITVLTLGFVTLQVVAPPQPVFRAPAAAMSQAPAVDTQPLVPVQPIQPWVEPVRSSRPVNPATEPVARLLRDGVVTQQRP